MRFQVSARLLIMPEDAVKEYMEVLDTILRQAAKIFVQDLVGEDGIPAWTGQARWSLKAAATITGAEINPGIIESNPKKNPTTGAAQGSAKFFIDKDEIGFSFRSWVVDLTKKRKINYLYQNEYSATFANRVHETPWNLLEQAWELTKEYLNTTMVPVLRDFNTYLFKHGIRIKVT